MHLNRAIPSEVVACVCLGLVGALTLTACGGGGSGTSSSGGSQRVAQPSSGFADSALVSNKVGVVATATTIDANLSNPWGLATAPGLPFWVADNNSNLATLYSGTGAIQSDAVTGSTDVGIAIPASAAGVAANPTGQVYNGGAGFLIPTSAGQETALFIFAGEGGTIAAWAKDSGETAVTAYDDGVVNGANHAVYKGLALGSVSGATFLYATDLHNNKIDVFDKDFNKPPDMQGKFVDPTIPTGFVPFGIAALSGQLYVTYAKQDAAMHDETTGAGLGYVDVFDFNGSFVSRFASGGALNAPWGMAIAPAGFGSLQGNLLIGNFGDGKINIFALNGTALATSMGTLTVTNGGTFAIPGLWSLVFGNGDADKPLSTLFYTAGFADQTDGVFGSISMTASAPPPNPY
ncbi:MAG: TIGR03118 family protein [Steroidobacteraceae bacterium]